MYQKDKYTIEVFALCYNEEHILQAFIDHYKSNFNATITFYDNESTDNSLSIIKENGCNYISFDSGGTINENTYLEIKNNCWKNSKADFVIVCDTDEFLEIPTDIEGCTIIKTKGFDMIGDCDSRLGVFNEIYSKRIMFSPKHIQEINYWSGCHSCTPVGNIVENEIHALLLHRRYISEEHIIKKYHSYSIRNSHYNRQNRYGLHYDQNNENDINSMFQELRKNAQII
jgi:glycosyltransferase involved in cell wall biosynthesis